MEHAPVADRTPTAAPDLPPADASTPAVCPFPHAAALATTCPVPHGATTTETGAPIQRSKADMVVRRLLRIPERPAHVSEAAANKSFQTSMLISGTRCTLTYVVVPFVLPAIGIATRVGPQLGLLIGTIAIVCDVFTIRRFFAADHKYRWHFSALALSVIVLLMVLLYQDFAALT